MIWNFKRATAKKSYNEFEQVIHEYAYKSAHKV